uniref:hypothetical protein n=1 Tax=Actinomadura sp. CA-154981 TaxID=3240037 RepID=UPI003F495307
MSALTVGVGMLAACSAGQSVGGNCTVPAGAVPGAAAFAAPPAAEGPKSLTAPPDPASGHAGSVATPKPSRSSMVTLVTGDRVRLDVAPDGSQTVLPAGEDAGSGSGGFLRFGWAGDQFAVPYAAVPYLGSTLDPRLFDVTYLARAKLDDERSSVLPVTVQTAGGEVEDIPAVRAGKMDSATVDKRQAAGLGRLLMKRWRESRGAGASAAKPLPATRIGLRPSEGTPLPADPPRAPNTAAKEKAKHYRTLSLDFVGPDGKPATAVGWVQNLDDSRIGPFIVPSPAPGTTPATGDPGPVKVSVPDGTYSLAFTILTPHSGTYLGADGALVVHPEVTVRSDRTITLDARTAKPYQMKLDPAVTGTLRVDTLTLTRTGTDGGGCAGYPLAMDLVSVQGLGNSPSMLSATPTQEVTKGTMGFDAISGIAVDPPTSPQSKPRYYLDFTHERAIPSTLTYAVPQSRLTTVHARMYDHVSGNSDCPQEDRRDLYPYLYSSGKVKALGQSDSVRPGEHTDYWYSNAPDRVLWATSYLGSECQRIYDGFRRIRPGERIDQEWTKAPLAPAQTGLTSAFFGLSDSGAVPAAVCPACRQGDVAMLRLDSYGDSDPTHIHGYPDSSDVQSDLAFYRNGTLVQNSESTQKGSLWAHRHILPLLPEKATYRLDWKYHRVSDRAATIRTNWTFRSGPDDPAAAMPESEVCTPDPREACSFLPLLFVRYDLALNEKSQAKADGPFTLAFTVAHQRNASAPSGSTATVAMSFDDGETWSDDMPATAGGGGRFTADVTHPPLDDTDGLVSLRVRAHDDEGNAVEQTIIRAYGLTG